MHLRVNRLSLNLHGVQGVDARRLSSAVARNLGPAGANASAGKIGDLRVDLTAARAASIDELSRRIADEVRRALERRA